MNALVTPESLAAIAHAAGLTGATRPGPAPLASPSYRAVESLSLISESDAPSFVKLIHPEMRDGFD